MPHFREPASPACPSDAERDRTPSRSSSPTRRRCRGSPPRRAPCRARRCSRPCTRPRWSGASRHSLRGCTRRTHRRRCCRRGTARRAPGARSRSRRAGSGAAAGCAREGSCRRAWSTTRAAAEALRARWGLPARGRGAPRRPLPRHAPRRGGRRPGRARRARGRSRAARHRRRRVHHVARARAHARAARAWSRSTPISSWSARSAWSPARPRSTRPGSGCTRGRGHPPRLRVAEPRHVHAAGPALRVPPRRVGLHRHREHRGELTGAHRSVRCRLHRRCRPPCPGRRRTVRDAADRVPGVPARVPADERRGRGTERLAGSHTRGCARRAPERTHRGRPRGLGASPRRWRRLRRAQLRDRAGGHRRRRVLVPHVRRCARRAGHARRGPTRDRALVHAARRRDAPGRRGPRRRRRGRDDGHRPRSGRSPANTWSCATSRRASAWRPSNGRSSTGSARTSRCSPATTDRCGSLPRVASSPRHGGHARVDLACRRAGGWLLVELRRGAVGTRALAQLDRSLDLARARSSRPPARPSKDCSSPSARLPASPTRSRPEPTCTSPISPRCSLRDAEIERGHRSPAHFFPGSQRRRAILMARREGTEPHGGAHAP